MTTVPPRGASPTAAAGPPQGAKPLTEDQQTSFWENHPILKNALEAGGTSAGLAGVGRGLMAVAPFTGPAAPALEVVGGGLAAAPIANTVLGAASGAAGQAVREYGRPILGKYTEPVATTVEVLSPMAGQKVGRAAYEGALGAPSRVAEEVAPEARKLGFKIDPSQVRQRRPAVMSGPTREAAKANQQLANRLVTKAAGYESDTISPTWLGRAKGELGKQFREIYSKDHTFVLDEPTVEKLAEKLRIETELKGAVATPSVEAALRTVFGPNAYEAMRGVVMSPVSPEIKKQIMQRYFGVAGVSVTGDKLMRLRSTLGDVAAHAKEGPDRYAAHELIGIIDDGVKSADPALAAKLAELRPKYRAWATLDELAKQGGTPSGNVSLKHLGEQLRRRDIRYTQGQSTNPLARYGHIGEQLGLESLSEHKELGEKTMGLIRALESKLGLSVGGLMLGEVLGHVAGTPWLYSAIVGGGAGSLANLIRRGALGQKMQLALAEKMRQPAKLPISGTIGAVAPGVANDFGQVRE